ACQVDVAPAPVPGQPPPMACTREFAPVCARRDGRVRTFDNACLARVAGFRIIHRGQCRATGPVSPIPPRPSRPIACTFEYAPVCARRGSRIQTFSNECLARAEGFV